MTAPPLVPPSPAQGPSLRDRARAREGSAELLLFRVAGEYFCTELTLSEEAIELASHAVHPVPGRLASRLGVVNVRAALLPLYTPAPALGLRIPDAAAMAIIFPTPLGSVAIAVDEVEDVFTADLASLRDAPGGARGIGTVLGALHHGGRLVGVVDAEVLISACRGEHAVLAAPNVLSGARTTRALKLETT